ncbi:HEAT repeat domain-containing protein [Bradyrhizobium sp. UFLA05-109]
METFLGTNMRLKLLHVLIVFTISATSPTRACVISRLSGEELKAQASIVVEAVVLAKPAAGHSFRGGDHRYDIRVDAVFKGEISEGPNVAAYKDLRVHGRGNPKVCPQKHGSGIEHDLVPGRRYKLFMRSTEDPEVLLAENGYWPPMRLEGISGIVAYAHTIDGASASAIDDLLRGLENQDAGIRESSARWLGSIGRPAQHAIPVLRQLLESDLDESVRTAAEKAIGQIEKR